MIESIITFLIIMCFIVLVLCFACGDKIETILWICMLIMNFTMLGYVEQVKQHKEIINLLQKNNPHMHGDNSSIEQVER